ncbi:MAG: nucleotidyltransferase family protein [Acidimicrobiales bacterium]|nr:nucleotidyltransferase family protein [Acidimicrobiales bacterium]
MVDEPWLGRLAGYGLAGAPPLGEMSSTIDEALGAVRSHKLIGVLAAAVADETLRVDEDDRARIARAHDAAMRESLLLEEMLLRAIAVLDDAGVDHRVLKGAALAHLVHPDPCERSFGDNDILLRPADVDRGVTALVDAGAIRPVPPLSASFDRRFAKSVTLRWHGPTELDVHRTLAAGPYGHLVVLPDLVGEPVVFELAGTALRTLPPLLHLVHGAIHVALGDVEPRLGNVRDLALLAARPDIDVDAVVTRATAWGCAAPVALGLQATRALGHDRSAIESWADAYVIDATDRRRLAAYADRSGRFRRQALASWRELSWAERPAFARALLVPSAANRAARGRAGRRRPARRRSG